MTENISLSNLILEEENSEKDKIQTQKIKTDYDMQLQARSIFERSKELANDGSTNKKGKNIN